MKFANDYLKELLGVQVCKLEFNLSHNDRWYYPLGEEPQALYGLVCMSVSFETNCVISGTVYGSVRVVQFEEEPNGRTWSYKCLCFKGKETSELISYLGVEMNKEQTRQYKQSLLSSVRKQQSTCEGIRKNIKRLQDELTLELAILGDIHREINELK